jgi:hypothetical protein
MKSCFFVKNFSFTLSSPVCWKALARIVEPLQEQLEIYYELLCSLAQAMLNFPCLHIWNWEHFLLHLVITSSSSPSGNLKVIPHLYGMIIIYTCKWEIISSLKNNLWQIDLISEMKYVIKLLMTDKQVVALLQIAF